MYHLLPEQLKILAEKTPFPLYVVGGSVRDFLCGYAKAPDDFNDWDICAPVSAEKFSLCAEQCGFTVRSQYKNTGTVKLQDKEGREYEFTSFRSDVYVRGEHTPTAVYFTEDITLDACRRDFTCDAVYYCVQTKTFCDPLGGISDIENKILRTVRESRRVFGEDGLRLLRLARQGGQLGFTPDEDTLKAAKEHASFIQDIAPERIFTELNLLLHADRKYGVKDGHFQALHILKQTGVLAQIFPELAEGEGMAQPPAFHRYDVLEHSLRCVLYAPISIRWAALLHDVGKPRCMREDGNFYSHAEVGAALCTSILTRLKAHKRLIEDTHALIYWHMYDVQGVTKENKLRRFFVENYAILPDLLALKQADYSACQDDASPSSIVARWQDIITRMQKEGAPFCLKDLKITGKDLLSVQIPACFIGKVLHELLIYCACNPKDNAPERLIKLSKGIYKTLSNNS
ncbi:MAG: CCA tRNA nucleotidyltransferase [Clostridia bacterium]|nr:CCA tRNA nucleotidyltransferase [Clostridia bacterium]